MMFGNNLIKTNKIFETETILKFVTIFKSLSEISLLHLYESSNLEETPNPEHSLSLTLPDATARRRRRRLSLGVIYGTRRHGGFPSWDDIPGDSFG